MSTLKTSLIQHPSASDPAIELDAAGKLWLAGGKVLQVVRATDSTDRSTTSISYVDVTGSSVTITPQKSTSSVLLIWSFWAGISAAAAAHRGRFQITDSSNNAISGAQDQYFGDASGTTFLQANQTLFAYSTPATTSAVTYKGRFCTTNGTSAVNIAGNLSTTQMYAIEVSA